MIEVTVHFGKTAYEVTTEHAGVVHWVDVGPTGDKHNRLRIFTTSESAEALAEAFVRCGASRVEAEGGNRS